MITTYVGASHKASPSLGWGTLLQAAVVYGYFRCVSDGNDLVVLSETGEELERFTFPRQRRGWGPR
jgi:cobalamin-dependent methionine synthase I